MSISSPFFITIISVFNSKYVSLLGEVVPSSGSFSGQMMGKTSKGGACFINVAIDSAHNVWYGLV